ncbi:MAG TPA: hypothetical protein VFH07_02055 [Chitinophagaceae bacterium]|jgi:hypothetical protein|nr:hypothetical protein [Chitinophagaceae bacterium]
MRKIISFMHISLDGFVAGPNGEMNWTNKNYEFRMMNYEIVIHHATFITLNS